MAKSLRPHESYCELEGRWLLRTYMPQTSKTNGNGGAVMLFH